jgi:S-DNA-T family DNA segregation ATPase FtsK/SpoIIIE
VILDVQGAEKLLGGGDMLYTPPSSSRVKRVQGALVEDDLWDEAVRVILKSKRGSASLLQRALGIGYTRASRLLDMMGEAGIVSDHKGSKAREVLMSLEDWEEAHGAPLVGGDDAGGQGDER